MKDLYLDCFSGISGDMTLGALLDLGADQSYVENHLRRLPIDPFHIHVHPVIKRGISASQLELHFGADGHQHTHRQGSIHHHHHPHSMELAIHHHDHTGDDHHHENHRHHDHRRAAEILAMIEASELPPRVKQRSLSIFGEIAVAEGKIHGIDPSQVHFHEVGAMDSIVDIIGVCLALENLEVERIYASPVATGQGRMRMAHGVYPIPAPATLQLLEGIPLSSLQVEGELTTPTGAGILKALASGFGPMPAATIERIGYGAGQKDFAHPNVLRAVLIQAVQEDQSSRPSAPYIREHVYTIEAQLDDMTGEAMGYAMESLFAVGALDVYFTPVYMKKNRPGSLLTVLALPEHAEICEDVILRETTTFGVRRSLWTRRILDRRFITVETTYGPITIKQALVGGNVVRQTPEYDDVARAARQHGVPFADVYEAAREKVLIKVSNFSEK